MGLFDALGSIISGIASEIDGGDDYPTCDMCGSKMTEFDGWAWYTCPECGNMVRVLDGEKKSGNAISLEAHLLLKRVKTADNL